MAEIKPFRAWRYNQELGDIENFTCPLFDVADKSELTSLYENPFNSIHLSLPQQSSISELITNWKKNEVLLQDPLPSIYVYYQFYQTTRDEKIKCLRGFICNIRLYDWNENIVLRHENTIPHSVSDRLDVLEQTNLNISPTHGLYTDKDLFLEKYMEECIQKPVYEFIDYQGVKNKLGIIQDLRVIAEFEKVLKNKQVILADGHHRYTASLEYQKKMQPNGNSPIHAWNYHGIYLTNTESNDITIFPTHRLVKNFDSFDENNVISKLIPYFSVEFLDSPDKIQELIADSKHTFGLVFRHQYCIARLKPEAMEELYWNFPDEVKELDLTILHFFILEKAFNIKGKDQKNSKIINFSFNFTKTLSDVENGVLQMAIITRNISMEEIKKICYSGFTFPQKSTYFYPKVVCGLLFQSVNDQEFTIEHSLYNKD